MIGKTTIKKINDTYFKHYQNHEHWLYLKEIYLKIKHIPQVPVMDFEEENTIKTPNLGMCLYDITNNVERYKYQFLDFLVLLNLQGYAHRDLYLKNVIIGCDQIYIIDWDFVTEDKRSLLECYDITGKGLSVPIKGMMDTFIFKSFPKMGIPSIAQKLNITMKDVYNRIDFKSSNLLS
jgi:serine/threonine protein kinase